MRARVRGHGVRVRECVNGTRESPPPTLPLHIRNGAHDVGGMFDVCARARARAFARSPERITVCVCARVRACAWTSRMEDACVHAWCGGGGG